MINAYGISGKGLAPLPTTRGSLAEDKNGRVEFPPDALWIDLYRPLPAQISAVESLGIDVPSLEEMEEIEISNRIYREDGVDYMTVVLPGLSSTQKPVSGPVTFILTKDRMVTIRHHAPRPFDTFPTRADRASGGCATPDRLFIGLCEEIIARLADLLEAAGRVLDAAAHVLFADGPDHADADLQTTLKEVGRQGELIGRVRLALLTLQRALIFFTTNDREKEVVAMVKSGMRDIKALEVHSDYLAARIGLTVDATMGQINLSQSRVVRIFSVVAVLFMPPTLVASLYGMNFAIMPELHWEYGYPIALGLMLISALGTYLLFKWKKWL
ncbi:magnesium transporter CorA family protein [Pseudoruegeria sp. HB172150]|uniref:magnesium transporter CorA family protein n=1 Tax=Pseudoruegeria sp. HB172150 TaxID=2721164 RepID=UPI0015545248|nr:magnesium transporter CorA family protein [Pseudoruegeria sp. HB172150]